MRKEEAWEKRRETSFRDILGEMGYKKEDGDFMVISVDPNAPKTEMNTGYVMGGWEKKERPLYPHARTVEEAGIRAQMTDNEFWDNVCTNVNGDGKIATGITGSNNGVYAAYMWGSNEVIVTQNPKIIRALENQMHFEPDQMFVPFSNGERPKDFHKALEWEQVKHVSSHSTKEPQRLMTKEEKAEAKKREEFLKSLQSDNAKPAATASNPLRDAALARKTRGY